MASGTVGMGIRTLASQFPEAFWSTYCQFKFSTVIISATRTVIMDYGQAGRKPLDDSIDPVLQVNHQALLFFPRAIAPIVKNTQSGCAGQPLILITGVSIPSRSTIPFDESSRVKAIPRWIHKFDYITLSGVYSTVSCTLPDCNNY